jgi:hypothetical protein
MKAIFINAAEQKVEAVEIEKGNQAIYDKLGYGTELMELVCVLEHEDGLMIDEEGLFEGHAEKENGDPFGFKFDASREAGKFLTYFQISGNGLIIGCDEEGESRDRQTHIDEIRRRVIWTPTEYMRRYKEQFI